MDPTSHEGRPRHALLNALKGARSSGDVSKPTYTFGSHAGSAAPTWILLAEPA